MDAQTLTHLEPVREPALAMRLLEVEAVNTDWRETLPVLTGQNVTLRELRLSDAPTLLAMLETEEVERFISPPPTTVAGFDLWSIVREDWLQSKAVWSERVN